MGEGLLSSTGHVAMGIMIAVEVLSYQCDIKFAHIRKHASHHTKGGVGPVWTGRTYDAYLCWLRMLRQISQAIL